MVCAASGTSTDIVTCPSQRGFPGISALGHKRTSEHVQSMSALPPKSGHPTSAAEMLHWFRRGAGLQPVAPRHHRRGAAPRRPSPKADIGTQPRNAEHKKGGPPCDGLPLRRAAIGVSGLRPRSLPCGSHRAPRQASTAWAHGST